MNESSVAQRVISAIKTRHITPRPFWNFALAEAVLWTAVVGAACLGALSFAVAYRVLANEEWDLYRRAGLGLSEILPVVFPYVWIGLLAASLLIAVREFRRTEQGYRFGAGFLATLLFMLTGAAAAAMQSTSITHAFETAIETAVPAVEQINAFRERLWTNPESGLLGGTVTEVNEDSGTITVEDALGQTWNVIPEDQDLSSFTVGDDVRILGTLSENQTFQAETLESSKDKKPVRRRTRPTDRGRNQDRD